MKKERKQIGAREKLLARKEDRLYVARLIIYDLDTSSKERKQALALWLKKKATEIQLDTRNYAARFTATYET